jgi:DnaJ-class molecular chaperone
MGILNRVYQILRAQGQRDNAADWDKALNKKNKEDEFYTGQSSSSKHTFNNSTSENAARDPQLARCYANLELPYGADLPTVRNAWKQLLKKYHPDLHAQDPDKRQTANQLTAELTQAYQELEKALSKKETR